MSPLWLSRLRGRRNERWHVVHRTDGALSRLSRAARCRGGNEVRRPAPQRSKTPAGTQNEFIPAAASRVENATHDSIGAKPIAAQRREELSLDQVSARVSRVTPASHRSVD